MYIRTSAFVSTLLASALAAASVPASASEFIGGYAIAYAKGPPYEAGATASEYTVSTNTVSAEAGSPGFTTSAKSQTSAWNNKIETKSDLSAPSAPGGIAYAAAMSIYAINQIVDGPGTTANLNYQFSVDGSFAPGPGGVFPPTTTPQNLGIFLVGYYATVQDIYLENGIFYLQSDRGLTTLNLLPEDPNWRDDGSAFMIPGSAKAACPAPTFNCLTATDFNSYLVNINVDIEVNKPFTVVALVSAFTNGQTDFFNTVKLNSISLDPAYTLTADDGGALVRNSDGTYALAANAVPEPSSWAMMLLGFGLIGGAIRYRRTRTASGNRKPTRLQGIRA